ncbi:MAG: amino acid adenylation domain-containing protein, partial [Cyanothece sp. SIO2G6]|nr:amino acid adenylation domain-containing protein [Cyanothece sp. SIO2G6]
SQDVYQFNANDCWTLFHSYAFDFSVWEIWGALLYGGRLVIVPYWVSRSPQEFYELLVEQQVTVLNQTPSAFRQLIQQNTHSPADALSLRYIIFGGEALQVQSLAPWFDRHGDTCPQLVNMYGITETTVHVTHRALTKADLQQPGSPIGQAIADLQLYVLDAQLQPVPIGVPGELHVGGAGLARGYLNRPDLTEQRFIPNPFGAGKLYKTGDLVRFLANSEWDYLGRIDHQVKIRGFRIELGEIESVLANHPQVREELVLVYQPAAGDQRLVAYWTATDSSTVDAETIDDELRQFLKVHLPDYMVPSAFVWVDVFPLTSNGKVDCRALPAPQDTTSQRPVVSPQTPTQEAIAPIFAHLLQLDTVSIHDNFFALGGHSLLATQVMSRLRQTFSLDLPLRTLFESPTIADLSHQVDSHISSTAQSHGQSHGQSDNNNSTPIIPATSYDVPIPLSFAQERLWFLDQLEPGNTTYNILGLVQLEGPLEVTVLERAIATILQRHAILRTTFQFINNIPMQVIQPEISLSLTVEETRLTTDAEIEQWAHHHGQQPFDLAEGPLVRFHLAHRTSPHSPTPPLPHSPTFLLVALHHIIADGWSVGVFTDELVRLYASYSGTQSSAFPPLPIQYADFAQWQRQWLQGNVLDTQLQYWTQQLADAPGLLLLPSDRPHPPQQTYEGCTHRIDLPPALTQQLRQLSLTSGTTLFMTLLAAYATLLYRYSHSDDIMIGSPIANRNRQEIEPLIGFFVNTLVLRTQFADNASFAEVLEQVRETTLAAYDHQDLPFEQLVEALQPERSLSHSPLFQVMFILQPPTDEALQLAEAVTLRPLPLTNGTAKFDLTLTVFDQPEALQCEWEYRTDLFDETTIARMAGHFQVLLEAIVANPKQPLEHLPLLLDMERQQLLTGWNDTAVAYPTDSCIHSLFEAQVERTPEAIALQFETQSLTYAQLNAKANQLAHHLQTLGVGPETLVGICVERSLEMVIGLFGILKAGGAYVPIDPGYPSDRLTYMLTDSATPVLLTQQHLVAALPEHSATCLCLDTDWPTIATHPKTNPDSSVQSTHLAYLIYTSGSTGKPKGVMNEHRGVCNRLLWMQDEYQLEGSDRVLQKTPFSFDVSVWEFFWPLLAGARLVVAKPEGHKDSGYLSELIAQTGITTLHFVPSMLQVFLETANLTQCSSIKRVICSGEALPLALQERFFTSFESSHQPQLHNLYGPTEAAIDVSYWPCHPDSDLATVPIGWPIANTQLYVLDRHLQPVPLGVAGELHIGGVQVARGYLNRPELSAAKFIENPFGRGRLYKTGDLVRQLANGAIEFLGRIDFQVKLRGFRIELGEIEAALLSYPQVNQAVVVLREVRGGDQQLVAYIVGEGAGEKMGEEKIEAVRSHLQAQLPAYMVPAIIMPLETMPLTPNGKVNRKALPVPSADSGLRTSDQTPYVAPRTSQETLLCTLFAQLLQVSPVGIHDSFFALGGHSLLAVQLAAQIQAQWQVQLPLATLFQTPTVAQLSQLLTHEHTTIVPWPTLVPIQPQGELPPLFIVPGAGGNVIYLNTLAQSLQPRRPVYGLQPKGLDGIEPCDDSVEGMAQRYIESIRTVQPHGPYRLAGHSFGAWVAYEMARQLEAAGESVAHVIALDTVAPYRDQVEVKGDRQEWQWLAMAMQQAEGLYGRTIGVEAAVLKRLPDAQAQYEYALRQLIAADILPEGALVQQLQGLMSVYKLNNHTHYFVPPQAAIHAPVTLVRSEGGVGDDPEITQQEWYAWNDWGWQPYSQTSVQVIWTPGDHHTMMANPQVETLAKRLSEALVTP